MKQSRHYLLNSNFRIQCSLCSGFSDPKLAARLRLTCTYDILLAIVLQILLELPQYADSLEGRELEEKAESEE